MKYRPIVADVIILRTLMEHNCKMLICLEIVECVGSCQMPKCTNSVSGMC